MRVRVSRSRYVQAAVLLLLVWLGWAVAWFVWARGVAELRSGDAYLGFLVMLVLVAIAAFVCVAVAIWSPGQGEIGGGAVLTLIGLYGTGLAVYQLLHWGEIVDPVPDRITPWVPWDSLAALPYTVILPAGVLLLVGGIRHVRDERHGSTHAGAMA